MHATSSRTEPVAAAPAAARSLVVWRFVDGKPGHENQSLGLVRALAAMTPVSARDVPVQGGLRDWLGLLAGRCTVRPPPAPDLLIGAGHATHAALLGCRRACGGRSVVLMRPSLPRRWFDLCIVPEHDGVPPSDRVLLTRGVLNPLRPTGDRDPDKGLILVGGPSAHYGWDAAALRAQVAAIVARDPRRWTLATSRRTPADTLRLLEGIAAANLEVVPSAHTAAGWLADELASAAAAWVTEDSVSMLYEALTAAVACGVLPVPPRRSGRVRRGLQGLLEQGVVTRFDDWQQGAALAVPDQPLREADRCARWIHDRWFAR